MDPNNGLVGLVCFFFNSPYASVLFACWSNLMMSFAFFLHFWICKRPVECLGLIAGRISAVWHASRYIWTADSKSSHGSAFVFWAQSMLPVCLGVFARNLIAIQVVDGCWDYDLSSRSCRTRLTEEPAVWWTAGQCSLSAFIYCNCIACISTSWLRKHWETCHLKPWKVQGTLQLPCHS